ncbi:MAG: hypothetical protein KJ954_14315 [Alphaproteobacteria bacterium]|nr:hypothetical protein [Alphaproteobacteria bacterium]
MSTAKYTLRQMIGRLMNAGGPPGMVMGTPAATFSTTGFTCAALGREESDYFLDWWLRFYSGTHKDNTEIQVTASVTSTGATTFSPAVVAAVDATDLFELWRDFRIEDVDAAINYAILKVQDEALADKVDETLAVLASTYEYTVPTGFYTIETILQEQATANRYDPYTDRLDPEKGWRILRSSTKKIWFDSNLVSLVVGRNLRVIGQQLAPQLTTDASTTDVNPAYIVEQAAARLHQSLIRDARDEHAIQAKLCQDRADQLRKGLQVAARGVLV